MKKINYFLEKTKLWKVCVTFWVSVTLFMYLMLNILFPDMQSAAPNPVPHVALFISTSIGCLLSLFLTTVVRALRGSIKFWGAANELEKKINAAKNRADLIECNKEYTRVGKMCGGQIQCAEMNKLFAIMDTKYQFLPE